MLKHELSNKNENIVEIPSLDYALERRGYGHFLYDFMIKHKNQVAQIDAVTGKIDTYSELLERCIRASVFLKKLLKPGDFISVCSFKHLNSCIPSIAAFFIGAIMGAVDPLLSLEDIVHLLAQTKPKVIFVAPDDVEMIEEVAKRIGIHVIIIVFGDTVAHVSFADALTQCTEEEATEFIPMPAVSLDDLALVVFSSGTTGWSKTLCHNHYSLICQTINNAQSGFDFGLSFGFYSMYWTVFVQCLGTSIVTGTARLIVPKFDKNNPWEPFCYELTYVVLDVFHALTLCLFPKPKEANTSSIKALVIAGGVVQSELMRKLQRVFVNVRIYLLYGQSEVFGYLSHFTPKDESLRAVKLASVGLGRPGISYKISDIDSGASLKFGEKGELCVKTKFAMIGYYNMDSSIVWDKDGWLKTGDIAYFDEDGCLYVTERIKEMFKFQGWHVTPSVIEKVLMQHPAVAIGVVLGKPHEYDGYRPMGVVVLKKYCLYVTEEQIQKFVDDRVEDRLKLRGGLKILDSVPMTPSGKINRWELKQILSF